MTLNEIKERFENYFQEHDWKVRIEERDDGMQSRKDNSFLVDNKTRTEAALTTQGDAGPDK